MSSSLLIYSPKCKHSLEVIKFINNNKQLQQFVKFHNVNELGIPVQYRTQIKSVPTLLTSNGKMLVGGEVQQWFISLLPNEITNCDIGGGCLNTCSLDDETGDDNFFNLENYGQSLQPVLTPELQAKISKNVSDAYQEKQQ